MFWFWSMLVSHIYTYAILLSLWCFLLSICCTYDVLADAAVVVVVVVVVVRGGSGGGGGDSVVL